MCDFVINTNTQLIDGFEIKYKVQHGWFNLPVQHHSMCMYRLHCALNVDNLALKAHVLWD